MSTMAWGQAAWGEHLIDIAGDSRQAVIAERIGVHQGTVSKWLSGARPSPGQVIDVAHILGASAWDALLAAGYLTPNDVSGCCDTHSDRVPAGVS